MQHRTLLTAVVLLIWLGTAESAPIEAYAQLPLYENVALSHDGRQVAFVTTVGEEREIVIQPLAALHKAEGISRIKAGKQKLRDLQWVGDDQLLIIISQSSDYLMGEQSEYVAASTYDLRRKAAFSPMTWRGGAMVDVLADEPETRIIQGKPFLFVKSFANAPGPVQALFRADLTAQSNRLVEAAPERTRTKNYSWAIDHQGQPVTQSIYDDEAKSWSLDIRKNGKWQTAYTEKSAIESPTVEGLGPDPDTVLVFKEEKKQWVLRPFSYSHGTWGEPLSTVQCCIVSYITDPLTHQIIGYSWMDVRRHYQFWHSGLQRKWQQVVQAFPGEALRLESWSGGLDKIIVRVFGKTSGAAYVLVDTENNQLSFLGNRYNAIAASDMATVKPVTYDAADGLKIPGYLTIPNNKPTKDLPLIVLPHGGPAARDELDFDWLAQALAAKGYLVLQPNFRGSLGLDKSHYEAGFGEYGRKMQTDLSDGARALIKLGVVDPRRICILGASYGGYAALNGVVAEADFYRCAISIAGISDLRELLERYANTRVGKESRGLRFMLRYIGADNIKSPRISELSPANNAARIKVPVLLIHGDRDSVVPMAQSQLMIDALRKAKKPYEFVKLKSEDHWLSRSATRLQTLEAVVKFLEAHNPP